MRRAWFVVVLTTFLAASASGASAGHAAATDSVSTQEIDLYVREFGLSPDEAALQIADREAVSPAINVVFQYPDIFGGVYVSHEPTFSFHILFTGDETWARQLLLPTLVPGVTVEFERVQSSLTGLRSVQARIIELVPELGRLGMPIVSVGRDTPGNGVVVRVAGSDAALSRWLSEDEELRRSGVSIRAVVGSMLTTTACTAMSSCTPWRGGIKIRPSDGTGVECSYGYSGRRKNGSTLYMITAGHCDKVETETWTHNGATIGTTNLNNLLTSAAVLGDAERVPRTTTTPLNLIYQYDFYNSYPINDVRTYNQQVYGDPVFMTGFTSGTKSGTIVDDDHYGCIFFRGTTKCMWGKVVDNEMAGGDSGGPTYSGNKGNGVITAIDDPSNETFYSTLELIETALDIWICTSSSC